LDYLYKNGHHLPDFAQYRPTPEVHVQTDFYYERQGVPGTCIFIDGPLHDSPTQVAHDHEVRSALENLGFGVIAVRHDRSIADQVNDHPHVFGTAGSRRP
jgi:hypothetical protein